MKTTGLGIGFHFEKPCALRDRQRLKEFIGTIFKRYRVRVESLSIIFCSDKYLLGINREYLQHDFFTDIITFNLADADQFITGEIYISVDRVKENARTEKTSFTHELHRVIFHGILHLCGFDDKTSTLKKRMTQVENKLLTQYFQ